MNPTCLLINGKIHAFDQAYSQYEALAIEGQRILASGSNSEILNLRQPGIKVIDLDGASVLPGFTDSHIHLQLYALTLDQVDCETESREACLARVQQNSITSAPGTWIRGHGWNQNDWDRFGTREDLDSAAPNNPVYLTAKSLHAGWANSRALEAAGLSSEAQDPPRGKLGRNPDGSLSGILFEDAMRLVSEQIPAATTEEVTRAILVAQRNLLEMGITSVHDFDGPTCFAALNRLRQAGQLILRVVKNFRRESLDAMINLGLATGMGDYQLAIGSLKLFSDGALGPETAAMLDPYEGTVDERGMLTEDEAEILATGRVAADCGIGLAVHAIGDRANREVLNALEKLIGERKAAGLPVLQHRMEHLQLMHPDDLGRPGALGIAASMQPIHAISDMEMANQKWGARVRTSYAWRSQLSAGAELIFGSDAPVESPNPFLGIHAAITRRKPDGSPGPTGWVPEERLTVQEALHAYLLAPHQVSGWSSALGRLLPGYLADLIILDVQPYDAVDEWLEMKPVGVMSNGNWVVPFE
jgi:predicted amidohydrolase YtcJ